MLCVCLAGLILYFVRGRDGVWTAIAQYAVSSLQDDVDDEETGARAVSSAISALVPTSDGSLAVAAGEKAARRHWNFTTSPTGSTWVFSPEP
jgi:hypothetical protein